MIAFDIKQSDSYKVNLQKGQELPVEQQNERFENQLTTATQRIDGLHAVRGRTRRATKFYIDESGKDNSPAKKTSKKKLKAVHKEDIHEENENEENENEENENETDEEKDKRFWENCIENVQSIINNFIKNEDTSLTFFKEDVQLLLLFFINERINSRKVEDFRLRKLIDNKITYVMNINKKTALSLQQELSDPDGLTVFKLMSIIIDYYTSDSTEVSFEDQDYANLDHKKHMISNFKNFVDDYQAENKEDEDSCELFSQELGKPNFFINIIILLIL
jgi:hypothetical protein